MVIASAMIRAFEAGTHIIIIWCWILIKPSSFHIFSLSTRVRSTTVLVIMNTGLHGVMHWDPLSLHLWFRSKYFIILLLHHCLKSCFCSFGFIYLFCNAWKVSLFGVILVCIFAAFPLIRTESFCLSFHLISFKFKEKCSFSSHNFWLFSFGLEQSSWSFERYGLIFLKLVLLLLLLNFAGDSRLELICKSHIVKNHVKLELSPWLLSRSA